MKEILCQHCSNPIRSKKGRRRTCNRCKAQIRSKNIKREWERLKFARDKQGRVKEHRANAEEMLAVERMSRQEVASKLRMTYGAVKKVERMALVKIREDAALRKLVAFWIEEGCPTASLTMTPEDAARRLLSRQQEVAEYYRLHEELVSANCKAEALQVLKEIRACQAAIGRALGPND